MTGIESNFINNDLFEDVEIGNLLNSLDEGALAVNRENEIIFYNDATASIINTDIKKFLNSSINTVPYFKSFFAKNNVIPSNIRELASGYKVSNLYKINGKDHFFENEKIDIYDKFGNNRGYLYFIRDITKEIEIEMALSHEARHDHLSGILNSKAFHEEIEKEVSRASRYGSDLSLLFIDINNFKIFNDTFGHGQGDEIIRLAGKSIFNSIRRNIDSAYRYGGDEFAVILPNTPAMRCIIVANRILINFQNNFKEKLKPLISGESFDSNLEKFIFGKNKDGQIGLSIGISGYKKGKSPDGLLKEADRAMYIAKRKPAEPVCIFE